MRSKYVVEAWPGEGYSMGIVWAGNSLLGALREAWSQIRAGKDGVTLRVTREKL